MITTRIIPVVLASVLFVTAAWAALTIDTGAIKTLDAAKHQIVLETGKTYETGDVDLTTFKVGDQVAVSFEEKDGKMVASKVEMAK